MKKDMQEESGALEFANKLPAFKPEDLVLTPQTNSAITSTVEGPLKFAENLPSAHKFLGACWGCDPSKDRCCY